MPKVRASSGMIGTTRGPNCGSRQRLRSSRVNAVVVDAACLPEPPSTSSKAALAGQLELALGAHDAAGERAVEGQPPVEHVLADLAVLAELDVGRLLVVGQRVLGHLVLEVEALAEQLELVGGHLLDLVGGVAALDVGPERPALDRLGEDHRGRARLLGGGLVGGVELPVVVAAAGEVADLLVGQVLDQLPQPRVGAEEVLAGVGARLDRVALELAVDGLVHPVEQHAVDVAHEQLVPLAAPDDLDHVPAGAAEHRLELLDDLAVAAHGSVEALEVAVDDPGEVVEALAGGEGDRAERLGLVALAVADEAPHP